MRKIYAGGESKESHPGFSNAKLFHSLLAK